MASGSSFSGGDFRRKWDRDQYEELARKRLRVEQCYEARGAPVKRETLKQRDYNIDLNSRLCKSQFITRATPTSQSAGYYCNVCDCVVKESINFLDHINGIKHQRKLGMSMEVERSSLDQVKKRFEMNKRKMEEKEQQYDVEQRLKELDQE
ncbi:hypothetical protein HAZT_HAZT003078, partial [Hyalella azteca]